MVTIRLHNTKTRQREVFAPIDPANVRMYVCGPTVYDRAHLGNARPVVVFDVLYRLLRQVYGADHVTYVRNFTDVDDKINAAALARQQAGDPRSLEALIAERTDETIGWYHADMDALGALRPNHEPRATAYIPQMVAMTQTLIDREHAYAAEGHVLFAVRSFNDAEGRALYGRLSGRSVDDMIAGARVEVAPYKRDPMDFVLWKPSTDQEPGWPSPWGRGRPGWHIECSAMARELLGESFDIHGGGIDLQFPHHENEIAQSRCAHPDEGFANIWLHNEMLQVEGKKMSKSLGNFFTVRDLLERYSAHPYHIPNFGPAIRLRFLQTGYRDPIDITDDSIEQAATMLGRFYRALDDVEPLNEPAVNAFLRGTKFMAAIADDLNTPLAVKLMIDALKRSDFSTAPAQDGSAVYVEDDEFTRGTEIENKIKAMLQFLGFSLSELKQFDHQSRSDDRKTKLKDGYSDKIESLLRDRAMARKQKDFARSDKIRAGFEAAGVLIKDTPAGWEWELASHFDPAHLEALK